MPRRSPYEISLTQREREEFQGITRKYTSPNLRTRALSNRFDNHREPPAAAPEAKLGSSCGLTATEPGAGPGSGGGEERRELIPGLQ